MDLSLEDVIYQAEILLFLHPSHWLLGNTSVWITPPDLVVELLQHLHAHLLKLGIRNIINCIYEPFTKLITLLWRPWLRLRLCFLSTLRLSLLHRRKRVQKTFGMIFRNLFMLLLLLR